MPSVAGAMVANGSGGFAGAVTPGCCILDEAKEGGRGLVHRYPLK